ncbi:peptidoglycan editing factor PgeF [Halobacillus karajensis]|uniref:Purine nucleoside phosphorylase n=1 Tax=Halobacillus karajensis TaxID=195088 RepID=A0A024P1X2_9BACI|nr:peptidoglycan editing factor PgeF [Halobacillus karajensis]CDQ19829.1 Laccase domain protein [Halobacillus karajensis]CDQ22289.1 Laccase domain protein [Halobacillus karajensis]CDQ28130.1 Laccase domain protein [Halobacillus karajensis]
MEPFIKHTIRQMSCFDPHLRVTAGLTTRQGGKSEAPFDTLNMGLHVSDNKNTVIQNRRLLAKELGVPLEQWVIGEQVHGTKVETVDHTHAGAGAVSMASALQGVDGLITNDNNLVLGAFFADCVPLYFYDPKTEWIGIAHAGWRGTVNGMGLKMIEALQEKGCQLENIKAVIGPSIGMNHYEVDEHVINHIPAVYKNQCVVEHENGKYQLALKSLHYQLMIDKGLKEENIQRSDFCTYEENELFYSHRRDQGKTGRMLGFITIRT